MTMWVVRNDRFDTELLAEGYVSIGWTEVGDLRALGDDRDAVRAAVDTHWPEAKPRACAAWAGMLYRFAYEMAVGDVVIAPSSTTGTLSFGVVDGPYEFVAAADYGHRRRVRWVKTRTARTLFPRDVLRAIGSISTLFRVSRFEDLFTEYMSSATDEEFTSTSVVQEVREVDAPASAPDEAETVTPRLASEVEQETIDSVLQVLLDAISHEQFEHFTADLLRALGYQARVTQLSGDGGVDVIAHRDPLGLEPPIIKVQCKHTAAQQGGPVVQQLLGALAPGELGLFVSLGSFTPQAFALERTHANLRLLGGSDIARHVLDHFDELPAAWRDLLPLRRVWVLDRDPSI